MDLTVYHGWKIYTHVGKPTKNEIPHLKRRILSWFDPKEWTCEDNHKTLIYHENIKSPIQIAFKDEPTEQEKSMGLNNYGIVFESNFFGLRNDYPHQQLCYEVLNKITWRKQAYLLIDDKWVRVSKRRISLKEKRFRF